jgi:hypothetical protein
LVTFKPSSFIVFVEFNETLGLAGILEFGVKPLFIVEDKSWSALGGILLGSGAGWVGDV